MKNNKQNKIITECKELLNEQTEPFQKKMKAKHPRLKDRVIGHGGQPNTPPFTKKPSMKRSKSAPPIGEDMEIDEAYEKVKKYGLGALAAMGLAGAAGAAYKMSQPEETPVSQAQAQVDMKPRYGDTDQIEDEDTAEPEKPESEKTPDEKFSEIRKQYLKALVPSLLGGVPKTKEEIESFISQLNKNSLETFGLEGVELSGELGKQNVGEALAQMTLFNPKYGNFEMIAGVQNLNTFINICSMLKMKAPNVSERVIFMEASKLYLNHRAQILDKLKNELGIKAKLQLTQVQLKENKKRILIKRVDRHRA
jgi:hypothetical protein